MAVPSGPVTDTDPSQDVVNVTITRNPAGDTTRIVEYYEGRTSRVTNFTYQTEA